MRLLLDTNVYIGLVRGDADIAERVRGAQQVLLSTVVAGELLFGFRNGTRFEANLRVLMEFLRAPQTALVPVTFTTADRFGRIAAQLRAKGRPIPQNDLWIAAQAMETGADLLSFDRHFEAVDGLALVVPARQ